MAGWGSILGIVGLGISAVGLVGSYNAGNERSDALDRQAEARQKSNELSKQKQTLQTRRQKVQIIRETRIKRAGAVSNAQAQNAQGSVSGGFGSIQTQGGSQQAFLNRFTNLTGLQNSALKESAMFGLDARRAGETANIFASASNVGLSIFNQRTNIAGLV